MSAELLSWLPLLSKLLLTAGIVVAATVAAERAGPLIGGLVATLPVTIWPAYVFLSLDHDAAYVAAAARSGLAINTVAPVFLLIYAVLAKSRGLLVPFTVAVASWIVLALAVRTFEWTLLTAVLLNAAVYPVCLWIGNTMTRVEMPRLRRAWYDLPLRILLVCALMAALLQTSLWAPPTVTGVLAVYPVSSTCLMLILHPRFGGPVTTAVLMHSMWGLFGISFGLIALSLAVVPLGKAPALALALAIPVTWNFSVWVVRRRQALATK